eukprot:scaffold21728_cov60-Phaeocystis_antarctica.AAC.1
MPCEDAACVASSAAGVLHYKVKWEFIITIPDSSFTLRALACVERARPRRSQIHPRRLQRRPRWARTEFAPSQKPRWEIPKKLQEKLGPREILVVQFSRRAVENSKVSRVAGRDVSRRARQNAHDRRKTRVSEAVSA